MSRANGVVRWVRLAVIVGALLAVTTAFGIEITLKNTFIEEFKNRATINTHFTVDKAHAHPNSAKKDGDLHVAGRAPEIQLAAVAEIMNAKTETAAVDRIHSVEGSGSSIPVKGIWRIWCEHGGDAEHEQGDTLTPFVTTNPDHIFEIHPTTEVDGIDTRDSFKKITGFKYKDAEQAFTTYENIRSRIECGANTTTISTGMAGYNYVEFVMELLEEPTDPTDDGGLRVFSAVLTKDEELLVRKRRMIFADETPPELAVAALHKGDRVRVLGIPRISLSLLSWRCSNAASRSEVLNWNLPYEIVVVAILGRP